MLMRQQGMMDDFSYKVAYVRKFLADASYGRGRFYQVR